MGLVIKCLSLGDLVFEMREKSGNGQNPGGDHESSNKSPKSPYFSEELAGLMIFARKEKFRFLQHNFLKPQNVFGLHLGSYCDFEKGL